MRKSIQVPGFSHGKNPTPAASIIGPMLMTGAIFGTDRSTGRIAQSYEEQCMLTFDNMRCILEAAGASFEDVLKVTFHLRPEASREVINLHWVNAFPDEDSRPARHVIVSDSLPKGMHLQCDLFAYIRTKV